MSAGPGRPVFLTGMMGAGKSTIAPLLAAAWGVPWIDLDVRVARIFGASVAALFARGEAQFRRCEHLSLRLLLAEPGLRARTVVIATGGGVVLDPASRALMHAAGHVVLLEAPIDELTRRLLAPGQRATRPLLAGPDEVVRARLEEKLSDRRSAYGEANMVVDTSGSPQDAVHRLLSAFSEVHP
jgi:shikimate kinase